MPRERARPSRFRRAGAALSAVALLAAPLPVSADLEGDADRLVQQWSLRGAEIVRLSPVFLERGRSKSVAVPRSPPKNAALIGKGCVTVALVAVRTADFSLEPEETEESSHGLDEGSPESAPAEGEGARSPRPPNDHRIRSGGGAAMISRCGDGRDHLAGVTIEMASARAAVEIIVARSLLPLGEIPDVLPERAAGPIAPRGDAGGPIEPGPLPERLARAEQRARSEGAAQVTRASMRASPKGGGVFDLKLPEGCHRVEIMAEIPKVVPRRATDIDAEARSEEGRLLARDRADVPDARLDFCLGEPALVEASFTGASGPVTVAVSDARWLVPAAIPKVWGPRARAGLAAVLLRRHAPEPREPPIFESLGVQGVTELSLDLEPGRCYLAAAALVRGDSRRVRLSARVGDRAAKDEVEGRTEGAALAFCAGAEDTAFIEVDVRGNVPFWVLELWPMGTASP